MIVTIEFIFFDPKLSEIKEIINNTRKKHIEKYGNPYLKSIEYIFNISFFDKIESK